MSSLVYVLNGPNLNMIGTREPEIYGYTTLKDVENECKALGAELGLAVDFRQSNHEGLLVDWVQEARTKAAGIIFNPAAYTHYSIAIMDALKSCSCPILEVHISNVHQREEFRHLSYVSKVATGVMAGFGTHGYSLAMRHMAFLLKDKK
ncbi:type II 3-dehydroquinate dehydratase [Telmatospirillum sp.]|uniref:type II 3-dehydroquinate dehydratase n=1 Tax=Telmatospirillum sp. TaxID=2079197 RepID=UPI00283BD7F8|nr:type II 3-dehydroquinate dehydratase [Telmatospirillum sp.]MDR3438157.1 type II 3-dehydroquinate dehydratase [Telmatospirillum sp.]